MPGSITGIWNLGSIGEIKPGSAMERLYPRLKDLERHNRDIQLWLETFFTGTLGPNAPSMVINDDGLDMDFRVEGDTDANLFFCDASTNRIGIGTATPTYDLEVGKNADRSVRALVTNASGGNSALAGIGAVNNESRTVELQSFANGATGTNFGLSASRTGRLISSCAGPFCIGTTVGQPLVLGTNNTEAGRIDTSLNLLWNGASIGTSGAGALAIKNGTAPTTSPADQIQIFSVDAAAGAATLGLRTEAAVVTEAVVSDRTLRVVINGTVYRFCLKA